MSCTYCFQFPISMLCVLLPSPDLKDTEGQSCVDAGHFTGVALVRVVDGGG